MGNIYTLWDTEEDAGQKLKVDNELYIKCIHEGKWAISYHCFLQISIETVYYYGICRMI